MQINLCTLAMRQQRMLDIFNTPATSSSRLHITVKSAAGDEVKALPQPLQSFTMPHACSQGTTALQVHHNLHGSQHASCMLHLESRMQSRVPSMNVYQVNVFHTGVQQRR